MSELLLAESVVHDGPDMDLHYLSREIVHAETRAHIWERQGIWDKAEWWSAYWERLHDWHYAWVRNNPPQLHACPSCGRIHENQPGYLTCFACGAHWLARG